MNVNIKSDFVKRSQQIIKIKLKSFDYKLIDKSSIEIELTAE